MKVLLIVIDGAAPRVLAPAIRDGRLPHFARLTAAGELHERSSTIFPSITPAATSTLITGAYPAEHGIAGAAWYDEARNEVAYYGDDFWVIAREGFGPFLRDFLVRLNGDRLTAPTVMEMVERTGRTSGCLNYLVYRGPNRHKVNVPWLMALLPGVPVTEAVEGPRLLHLGDFVAAGSTRTRHRDRKGGLLHRFGMDDASTATLLAGMAEDDAWPDFTVAYFADNDFRSHEVGPHAAFHVIEDVDAALGAMFDAAGGFERFMRDRCVIVTSDHGHCDVAPDPKEAVIDLQATLSEFAHGDLGRPWREQDDILICPNMRAAQIYVHEPLRLVERVAQAALGDARVDLAMWRTAVTDPGVPGYTVRGPRGRLSFWRDSPGSFVSGSAAGGSRTDTGRDDFGTVWEWRGDLAVLGLERSDGHISGDEYPNAFERIAGALEACNSGDVWVTARPGTEFDAPGGRAHVGGGSHGALHALDSLSPVIAAGAPRQLPRVMRSVDIAPLCMDALGVPMRYAVGDPRA